MGRGDHVRGGTGEVGSAGRSAATHLAGLADELLGPHAGSERAPCWPCPNPDHPQTGKTPPITVFTGHDGEQRWHCHGCGNHGTAIDLVMQVRDVDVRRALGWLAWRTGLPASDLVERTGDARARQTRSRRPERSVEVLTPRPVAELDDYVTECAEALWRPEAGPIRRWLTEARGLPENVLRLNRVGADLGSTRQLRPEGLPGVRRAVVLPALVDGGVCYVQLRVLGGHTPKYLNPAGGLARNPRVGLYQPAQRFDLPLAQEEVIVTEGIIDALSAAAGGYTAAAVLSATYADPAAATTLARLPGRLVVAFDPDPAGRAGAERLVQLLNARQRPPGVMVLRSGDLNEHLVRSHDWPLELAGRVQHATARPGLLPPRGLVMPSCP